MKTDMTPELTFDLAPDSLHSSRSVVNATGGRSVKTMQGVIVRWMARQLERLHWTAERWANEAELAPTTVTRAMSEKYQSVSSVPTLYALARAAGVPSILDFLDNQGDLARHYPVLRVMLEELLPAAGCRVSDETIGLIALALGKSLNGMTEQDPENVLNVDVARAIARANRSIIYGDGA